MEKCPKCKRLRVEYDPYQQRQVCTNPDCDWKEDIVDVRKSWSLAHERLSFEERDKRAAAI